MYLLINGGGKYWRMDYRFAEKRKTLALGTYPEVSLLKARQRREKARELLADGIDPSTAKQEEKAVKAAAAANTFEVVAREWLAKTRSNRAQITQDKVTAWLENDAFPYIGKMPIADIGPRDVLEKVIRKVEARAAIDTAHRLKQLCGQVFRFAVVSGLADPDVIAVFGIFQIAGCMKCGPSHHDVCENHRGKCQGQSASDTDVV
jgi:hypothetical protein